MLLFNIFFEVIKSNYAIHVLPAQFIHSFKKKNCVPLKSCGDSLLVRAWATFSYLALCLIIILWSTVFLFLFIFFFLGFHFQEDITLSFLLNRFIVVYCLPSLNQSQQMAATP